MIWRKNFKSKYVLLLTAAGMLISSVHAQSPSFNSFMNPVIPGDHPDATLTRIGNHFYTTGSSFNVTPVIYHSTDLVHWEAISQPVKASWSLYDDRPGGGCWGGHIVYYNGQYWDFFSRANTMYFVTASDPKGPWSEPVRMNNPASLSYSLGYDNSIFIDDDNRWYLLVKNGQPNGAIVELGPDGQPAGAIYNLTWLNPAPDYPYSWAEGPVMWKYKGYYYYSFARDLAGGQKVMRSTTLTADQGSWEMLGDFFNESDPLKPGSLFASPNHASPVVMLDDSTHWIIHPLYAKGEWRGQGRQGLLNQVHYDENLKPVADYPVNKSFVAPELPGSGIPWMVPKSDFFSTDVLNPEWSLLGYTLDNTWSLTDRPGWLHLSPKSSSKANTVIKNDGEHNYSLITRLEFEVSSVNDQAGLQIMRGDETKFVKLFSSLNEYGHKVIAFSFESKRYEAENTIGNILWLKIVRINHNISGYFSKNGTDWIPVGNSFDISDIDSYSDFSSFTGTRQGLFVQGNDAYFDLYIYRDAYTPILAECPANQSGTVPTTKTDGIYQLDSIHANDWALYAGVEFGNSEYPKIPKYFEATASCAGSGGTIEVWLDSIGTGSKISECIITGTGDWNTFKTFSAAVSKVQGRHDVYLLFNGTGEERLFKLKWIRFVPETAPEYVLATVSDNDTLQLKLDQPVVTPSLPSGLTIEANGSEDIPVSDISLSPIDSSLLIITLVSSVDYTDELTISYTPGTITNLSGISLMPFTELTVDNLLPGAIPKVKLLETKHEGDTIWMHLSKKMNSPASHAGDFLLNIEGENDFLIVGASQLEGDSSVIVLLPGRRIYYEDLPSLTYTGNGIEAANGGILAPFTSFPICNTADGYPPVILSAVTRQSGINFKFIDLAFDKPMLDAGSEKEYFSITINSIPATIGSISTDSNTISLGFNPYIKYGDIIMLSFSGGNVRSCYNGKLEDFADYAVTNTVPEPIGISSDKNNEASGMLVFPNPLQTDMHVRWEAGFTSLEIIAVTGEQMMQLKLAASTKEIHVPVDLPSGMYIVKLGSDLKTGYRKVIIE